MQNLSEKEASRIAEKVIQRCDIYPKPAKDNVKIQVIKLNKLLEMKKDGVSEKRLIRKVSKSFEIKGKFKGSEWIMFTGESVDLER
jgi:hypothetical protein